MSYIKITDQSSMEEIIPHEIFMNEVPMYYEEIFTQIQKRNPRLNLFHIIDTDTCVMEIYKQEKKVIKGYIYNSKKIIKRLIYTISLININTFINLERKPKNLQSSTLALIKEIENPYENKKDKFLAELKTKILKVQ